MYGTATALNGRLLQQRGVTDATLAFSMRSSNTSRYSLDIASPDPMDASAFGGLARGVWGWVCGLMRLRAKDRVAGRVNIGEKDPPNQIDRGLRLLAREVF